MKRLLIRTAKILGILVVLLFLSAFVWANWSQPTPGEKAAIVNFVPYDISQTDSLQVVKMERTIEQIAGVRGATFNKTSGILSVAYGVEEVDKETIEAVVNSKYRIQLKEKQFVHTGPRCPVDGLVNTAVRIKKTLCLRD